MNAIVLAPMSPRTREPSFCTRIGGALRCVLVIDSAQPLAALGNCAAAFLTGTKASGIDEDVHAELAEFSKAGCAAALVPGLFELRWVDDNETLSAVESSDDDGVNLMVVSPWGCHEAPRAASTGLSNIAIFLRREPTQEELTLLQQRATLFFSRHEITDLVFFLVRQVMTVETVRLGPGTGATP